MNIWITHPTMALRWSISNCLFKAAFWMAPEGRAKDLLRAYFSAAGQIIMDGNK